MKLSTINKIEKIINKILKWFWIIWKSLIIIFAIILIFEAYETHLYSKKFIEYETIDVPTSVDCNLDESINKFNQKYEIKNLSRYFYKTMESKYELEYVDHFEDQEVKVKKEFNTLFELDRYLKSK